MARTFSSERTLASISLKGSLPNTGVNKPSFMLLISIGHFGPCVAGGVTFENRIDHTCRAIAVFECRERRRLRVVGRVPGGNEGVNIAHHVAERIGPAFLVAPG